MNELNVNKIFENFRNILCKKKIIFIYNFIYIKYKLYKNDDIFNSIFEYNIFNENFINLNNNAISNLYSFIN